MEPGSAAEVTRLEVPGGALVVEALSRGLLGDRIVVDPDVLDALSHDDAEWAPAGKAVAGVRARPQAEVQHVVRACADLGAPVVPRGAGTGPRRCSMRGGWRTRHSSGSGRYSPRTSAYRDRRSPRCWSGSPRSGRGTAFRSRTTAHAGDGNLHPLIITPAGDETARAAAQAAFDELLDDAIALGRGHRGARRGLLKRDGMRRELDPGSLAMQDAIRRTLDPRGVFNPGKG